MSRQQTEWGEYPECPHCGFVNGIPEGLFMSDLMGAEAGHKPMECDECGKAFVAHAKVEIEYCGVASVERAAAQEGK